VDLRTNSDLYNINWLIFITETVCGYCAVRTGYLNTIYVNFNFNFKEFILVIILSCITMDLLGSGMWGYGLDRAGSRYGQVADTYDCGNEPSGSIKYGEFLDKLKTC
jgi:hypothetical protein